MAASQARAGVCFAGAVSAGLYQPGLRTVIGGTVTTAVEKRSLRVDCRSRQPNIATGKARSLTVSPYESFEVLDGGDTVTTAGKVLFAGHILPRSIQTRQQDSVTYDAFRAVSYRWLIDRFAKVTKEYFSTPINGMVHDIVTNYTDGFSMGLVDSSLGTLAMTFAYEDVSNALDRIAAAVGAFVVITPDKRVSLLTSFDDGNPFDINDTNTEFWNFAFSEDATQTRTRVIVEGRGSKLAADVAQDSATVECETASWASTTGGSARIKQTTFTYTGVSGDTLTGCTGVPEAELGSDVNIIVQDDDAAAQTTVATALGGGLSGVVTHYIQDRRLSEDEATKRAAEDLTTFSTPLEAVSFQTRNRFMSVNKTITVTSLTVDSGRYLNASLATDRIVARAAGKFEAGSQTQFLYDVTCTPLRVTMPDLFTRTLDGTHPDVHE